MNEVDPKGEAGQRPPGDFVPWGKRHGLSVDDSISYPLAAHLLDSYAATVAL